MNISYLYLTNGLMPIEQWKFCTVDIYWEKKIISEWERPLYQWSTFVHELPVVFVNNWEASWYMVLSLVITRALFASFYCPTTRSYYKYRRINEQIPNELSKFRKDSVNFAKSKRSEKRPPCAQIMKFWSPKKRNFRPPHYRQVFFAKKRTHFGQV